MDPEDKREIDSLMHEIPASSIPIEKILPPEAKPKIDLSGINQEVWSGKSNSLLSDYKYGEALALYGKSELTNITFFKRFATAICSIISNECQKRGTGSESLKPYFLILENCLLLIAKEIDKKELKDQDVSSIIASLHGFISNYNQRKENK